MNKIRKALVAAVGALVSGLIAGFTDGQLTWAEVGTAVGLGIAAGWATYRVRNEPTTV